jgi:hypothetical protein
LTAAIVGAGVAVGVALVSNVSIGIVTGGILGPLVGLLIPKRFAAEAATAPSLESEPGP